MIVLAYDSVKFFKVTKDAYVNNPYTILIKNVSS